MANDGKFQNLENGKKVLDQAIQTSAGAGDANKIARTDASGRFDTSLMPVGIGADTQVIEASENLSAGNFVNIWNDGGTIKVRKADNSNQRDAHGFVLAGVTSGNSATVYFEGTNTQLAGMTLGARQYLGTSGAVTETPVSSATETHQFLGVAKSATEMNVEMEDGILLNA